MLINFAFMPGAGQGVPQTSPGPLAGALPGALSIGAEGGFAAILGASMLNSTSLSGGLGDHLLSPRGLEPVAAEGDGFDLLSLLSDPALFSGPGAQQQPAADLVNNLSLMMQQQGGAAHYDLAALMQGDARTLTAFDNLFAGAGLEMTGSDLRQMLGQLRIDSDTLTARFADSDTPMRATAGIVTVIAGLLNAFDWPDIKERLGGFGIDLPFDPNEIRGARTDADQYRAEQKRKRDGDADQADTGVEEVVLDRSESALFATAGLDPEYAVIAEQDSPAPMLEMPVETAPMADPDDAASLFRPQAQIPEMDALTGQTQQTLQPAESGTQRSGQPAMTLPTRQEPPPAPAGQPDQAQMPTADEAQPSLPQAKDKAETLLSERAVQDAARGENRRVESEPAAPPPVQPSRNAAATGPAEQLVEPGAKSVQTAEAIRAATSSSDSNADHGSRDPGNGQPAITAGKDADGIGQNQKSEAVQRGSFAQDLAQFRGSAAQNATVAGQVALHMQRMAASRTDVLTLQLEPADLGRVDVRLEMQDGRVQARIAAENPQALDLLRQDSRSLERALQQAGLNTDGGSLNFSLRDQGQSGQDRHGDGGPAMAVLTQPETGEDEAFNPATTPPMGAYALSSDGRLDVKV